LPLEAEARRVALERAAEERHTLIWRVPGSVLPAALAEAASLLGDRAAALCSAHGTWRGPLSAVPRDRLDAHLVVEGAAEEQPWTEARVRARVRQCVAQGMSTRDAARAVAEDAHWPRRQVYQILLEVQSDREA
jgi:16S rRNA C1402 (ribose-2'-O) methylase RsmI